MTSEHPRSVEDIFQNYLRRKQGLIRALTEDSNELFKACDPERDNQCLYGTPNGTWMVDLPAEEVPPELPEPCLGINFARDGLQKKDWMALVAVHSDAWLLSVAFYYAAKLDSHERMALFSRINSMPTLFEIVTGKASSSQVPGAPSGEGRPLRPSRQGPKTGTSGRLLSYEDISPALKGREAEMFWPDDETWYQVTIISVNIRQRSARWGPAPPDSMALSALLNPRTQRRSPQEYLPRCIDQVAQSIVNSWMPFDRGWRRLESMTGRFVT